MANIIDIAKKTGLSPSTVSRALSKPEKVAAGTRQRVLAAIDEAGYETNIFARNLRQGGSRTIGLVVSDILNPFHAMIVKSIQDEVYREGFTLMVGSSDEDPRREETLIAQLRSHQLQGLIIIPTLQAKENLKNIDTIPVIEIDRCSGYPHTEIIRLNNAEGMRLATQHLTDLGHRHIAYISGSVSAETFKERLEGFRHACPDGVNQQIIELPGISGLQASADAACRTLLKRPRDARPSAVIAANNDIAAGVVAAIYQCGLSLPDDLSFIAFDDPHWAAFFPCPITTIRQPVYEMGQFAAQRLFSRIRGEHSDISPLSRFAPELIVRRSTRPPVV